MESFFILLFHFHGVEGVLKPFLSLLLTAVGALNILSMTDFSFKINPFVVVVTN